MASRWRQPAGTATQRLDAEGLLDRLGMLGEAGLQARALDDAVEAALPGLASLSPLTEHLAEAYLERIKQPLKLMSLQAGVYVTTRAYLAHVVVEADPAAYGAAEVPVLGTLPPPKHGRPPRDLLNRVVKATRRGFEHIRALDAAVWDGFVACTVARVHERSGGVEAAPPRAFGTWLAGDEDDDGVVVYLDESVVDGLCRFGWVLRQTDIHYRLEPERRSDPS